MPSATPFHSHPPRGWTLLELLTVTLIVALACALALPMLSGAVTRLGADLLRMQLVTVFNMTRNTAITRAETVAVCPSVDGSTCGDEWGRGWLIHRDRGAAVAEPAAEDILQFQSPARVQSVRVRASAGRSRLRFQRDGRSAGSTLTVSICAGDTLHSRVIVNNVGRTRARRVRTAEPCPH